MSVYAKPVGRGRKEAAKGGGKECVCGGGLMWPSHARLYGDVKQNKRRLRVTIGRKINIESIFRRGRKRAIYVTKMSMYHVRLFTPLVVRWLDLPVPCSLTPPLPSPDRHERAKAKPKGVRRRQKGKKERRGGEREA